MQESAVVTIAPTPTSLQENYYIRRESINAFVFKTHEKSFGDPNHMGGVKTIAIIRNQKQKLAFGNTLLKSS